MRARACICVCVHSQLNTPEALEKRWRRLEGDSDGGGGEEEEEGPYSNTGAREATNQKTYKGEDVYPVPYMGALLRTARATFHMHVEVALKGTGKIRGEMPRDYLHDTAMAASTSRSSPRSSPANPHLPLFLLVAVRKELPVCRNSRPTHTHTHTHLDCAIRRVI